MKKACIITWWKVLNYGAQLQAYALKCTLEEAGYQVYFYDYHRNERRHNIYTILQHPIRSLNNALNKKPPHNDESEKFYKTRDAQLKNSLVEFKQGSSSEEYDLCIVGSDEIFSIAEGFNLFQFAHGIKAKKIVSYAASFGSTTYGMVNFFRKNNVIKQLINQFDSISVRDENSKMIIDKITGGDSRIDVDPVFLRDWDNELDGVNNREQDILLYYSYSTHKISDALKDVVLKYAKGNGLKVVSVGYYHEWCDDNVNLNSFEFLKAIYNSKCVVTTTFHGSALSILFNKRFAVVPQVNNKEKIYYLLKQFGVEDHVATDAIFEKVIMLEHDSSEQIKKLREKSLHYLNAVMD